MVRTSNPYVFQLFGPMSFPGLTLGTLGTSFRPHLYWQSSILAGNTPLDEKESNQVAPSPDCRLDVASTQSNQVLNILQCSNGVRCLTPGLYTFC